MSNTLVILTVWMIAFVQPGSTAVRESADLPVGSDPQYCPAYRASALYRARRNVIEVDVQDDWENIVESAAAGTEILFDDGVYELKQDLVKIGHDVTLRSASGDREHVVIRGAGYGRHGQGLVVAGDRVTIAELTVTGMRDHGIFVKPDVGGGFAPVIYGVHVFDIGTQHVKSNAGSVSGVIACSLIGYTDKGVEGDYNGAINLHGATAWSIRDNEIYNIAGDGSGCNVNRECGRYVSGPAILVWNNSRDTVVERNVIKESFRNIAFGLGSGHHGGSIRNNTIIRTVAGDAGIELQGARGAVVENNTVLLYDRYRGAIEYRQSENVKINFNRISTAPWNRGGNTNIVLSANTIQPVPKLRRAPVAGCGKPAL